MTKGLEKRLKIPSGESIVISRLETAKNEKQRKTMKRHAKDNKAKHEPHHTLGMIISYTPEGNADPAPQVTKVGFIAP